VLKLNYISSVVAPARIAFQARQRRGDQQRDAIRPRRELLRILWPCAELSSRGSENSSLAGLTDGAGDCARRPNMLCRTRHDRAQDAAASVVTQDACMTSASTAPMAWPQQPGRAGRPSLAQASPSPRRAFAPGGSTDIVIRLLAERMTALLGQQDQWENRRAATPSRAEYVARARPTADPADGRRHTRPSTGHRAEPALKAGDFAPVMLATPSPSAYHPASGRAADVPPGSRRRRRGGADDIWHQRPTTLTNVAMLIVMEKLRIAKQDVTIVAILRSSPPSSPRPDMLTWPSHRHPVHRNGRAADRLDHGRRVESTPRFRPSPNRAGLEVLSWFGLLAPPDRRATSCGPECGRARRPLKDAASARG